MASAAILTIGNEIVSGDVPNTNASWLAQRLEALGVAVRLIAAVPDDVEQIAAWVRAEAGLVDHLLVTGGLGGTPDDLTREAIATAFYVERAEEPLVAAELRARFTRDPEYAARWAMLPVGSRPLVNPLGGAPGFAIGNVFVLPGLPAEMEAMFDAVADGFRGERPIGSWRRTYRTTEGRIVRVLEETTLRYPAVRLGSYPSFRPEGSEVEIVVKSDDPEVLAVAVAWLEPALDDVLRGPG